MSRTRRVSAAWCRSMDKLTRRVQANLGARLRECRPTANPGWVVMSGTPVGKPGQMVVRDVDALVSRRLFARALTSDPAPLSGRIRSKIKKR